MGKLSTRSTKAKAASLTRICWKASKFAGKRKRRAEEVIDKVSMKKQKKELKSETKLRKKTIKKKKKESSSSEDVLHGGLVQLNWVKPKDVAPMEDSSDSSSESDTVDVPQTHGKPQEQSRESKTLFVGNLPYSIKQDDIKSLFKDAGKVVEVCFASDAGGFKGYGRVEFDTTEAALKAFELNGEQLMGRPLRLEKIKEKEPFTIWNLGIPILAVRGRCRGGRAGAEK